MYMVLTSVQSPHLFRLQVESFPDDFFRRTGFPLYKKSCALLDKTMGAEDGSIVLLENATVAVNTVLHSLSLKAGDILVINDNTYNACKLAAREIARRFGAIVESVDLPVAITTSEEIIEAFNDQVEAIVKKHNKPLRFVLLDAISSPTAILMPIREMTESSQRHGAEVMIDAAHAPGQYDIRLASLKAQWYTGNLHKWCFTMKGCAFLYTKPAKQATTQSLVISHFAHRSYMVCVSYCVLERERERRGDLPH
jgi:isopenicillin-N epimerase